MSSQETKDLWALVVTCKDQVFSDISPHLLYEDKEGAKFAANYLKEDPWYKGCVVHIYPVKIQCDFSKVESIKID